jgi:hypothetical protein
VHVHSRALLSSEALEQHLCVAIDTEVLNGLGILRRACRILPGGGLGEYRAQWVSESLHRGLELSRRQSCVWGEYHGSTSLAELVLSEVEAATHMAGILRLQLGPVSKLNPKSPVRARNLHENTSSSLIQH